MATATTTSPATATTNAVPWVLATAFTLSAVHTVYAAAAGIEDPNEIEKVRKLGVIDLPTVQKKLNLHYTLSLDLFGSEVSTNAANAFNAGLKGRFRETAIEDDHKLENSVYPVLKLVNGEIRLVDEPALTALNMRLRDDYTNDCAKGVERFNKIIERTGVNFRLKLPHRAFHRQIGAFAGVKATPEGRIISDDEWTQRRHEWLPTETDRAYVQSLMGAAITEPGRMANWIAPPARGIDNKPIDFEYVRFN